MAIPRFCPIAGQAYVVDAFRAWLAPRDIEDIMSARARCIVPFLSPLHDSERYPARNAVERSRGWLKHGRHVAARYGQYAQRYLCFLYPAGA